MACEKERGGGRESGGGQTWEDLERKEEEGALGRRKQGFSLPLVVRGGIAHFSLLPLVWPQSPPRNERVSGRTRPTGFSCLITPYKEEEEEEEEGPLTTLPQTLSGRTTTTRVEW